VIINTGTRAVLEPVPGLVDAQPLTHIEALELDEVPEHLFVIGGGYVGLGASSQIRAVPGDAPIRKQGDDHRSQ
jgi:pyruvate/2-oxoglutarate dehydrogenase complex dihydrolipoamide dehydrogenase (E3) component